VKNPQQLKTLFQLTNKILLGVGTMREQNQTAIESPYIDIKTACKYLCIAKATLYQRTHLKTIPFYKINRKILFKVSELDQYVESHRVKTQAEIETEASTRLITRS